MVNLNAMDFGLWSEGNEWDGLWSERNQDEMWSMKLTMFQERSWCRVIMSWYVVNQ